MLAKRLKLELKTARRWFNELTPSKQETSLATSYRHVEILPFPVEHRTPPDDRMEQSPEATEGYKAWQFLNENCNPELPTLNLTPEMLKGWLEESSYAVKKPSTLRKVPPFPPLSFVHKPYETLCVVVNDVFA